MPFRAAAYQIAVLENAQGPASLSTSFRVSADKPLPINLDPLLSLSSPAFPIRNAALPDSCVTNATVITIMSLRSLIFACGNSRRGSRRSNRSWNYSSPRLAESRFFWRPQLAARDEDATASCRIGRGFSVRQLRSNAVSLVKRATKSRCLPPCSGAVFLG